MFMTPGESLAPCLLLLGQKSYLSYIKKVIKNILQTTILLLNLDYKTYAMILKNRMQKMLDTIIGENQSPAIRNRTVLHTLSTIRDIIDLCVK